MSEQASDKRTSEVAREPFEFASTDGRTRVHAFLWRPQGTPRATVLLVHGMAEHISRYDDFARFLAAHGIAVAGHDQIGHGETTEPAHWGEMPLDGGARILVEDVHRLRQAAAGLVGADVPTFVFGHSMGSFVARVYAARHGAGLAGVIICGTGFLPSAASHAAEAITWWLAFLRGEDYRSRLVDDMGVGSYAKAVEGAEGPLDWLSHNRANVVRYEEDPACGFMFSVGAYHAVAQLTSEADSPSCAEAVPHDLPLLYIAGMEDPVGSCGEGVRQAARLAREAGSTDVMVSLYPGMRHEILNEDGHERVYDDVLRWVAAHVPGAAEGGE